MSVFVEQYLPNRITAPKTDIAQSVRSRIKKIFQEELIRNLKSNLFGQNLPTEWADDIDIYFAGTHVELEVNNDAIMAHEEGIDPHPQTYLIGEVVPIETDTRGDKRLVFRKCTPRSLMQGKFWHPGMAGKGFIQDALTSATQRSDDIINAMFKANKDQYGIIQKEKPVYTKRYQV